MRKDVLLTWIGVCLQREGMPIPADLLQANGLHILDEQEFLALMASAEAEAQADEQGEEEEEESPSAMSEQMKAQLGFKFKDVDPASQDFQEDL